MPDSKFFGIPFATSGDRATIPEAVQPSGAISFTQGFGPDYERDPGTDPLAKRIPRDKTNEYLFQVTNAIKFIQLYGVPEWFGPGLSYPLTARVRYAGLGAMRAWVSLVANNTSEPGTDDTKWALDEVALEASAAEVVAGVLAGKFLTPRRLSAGVQQSPWTYATAGGTANALTATLVPAPSALSAGMRVWIMPTAANTGAATFSLNGFGTPALLRPNGGALRQGDILVGQPLALIYTGSAWQISNPAGGVGFQNIVSRLTAGTQAFVAPVTGWYHVEVTGAGGGGGTYSAGADFIAACGGGGGKAEDFVFLTVGQSVTITVGSGGVGGSSAGSAGGGGGASSFGTLLTASGGGGGTGQGSANGSGGVSGVGTGGAVLYGLGDGSGFQSIASTNGFDVVGTGGGPGAQASTATAGAARGGQGPGGGGGGKNVFGVTGTGGPGAAGAVIVKW